MKKFDLENDPEGRGDCANCHAQNSMVNYHCKKCGYNGLPKRKAASNDKSEKEQLND